jgi:hypothetical protein
MCVELRVRYASFQNILFVQNLCDSDNKANGRLNLALIGYQRQTPNESSLAIFRESIYLIFSFKPFGFKYL